MSKLNFSAPENAHDSELKKVVNQLQSPVETTEKKPDAEKTPETEKKPDAEKTENWQGDSRYFQTGKKAGQLKPSAKQGKLNFVKSTEGAPATTEKKPDAKGLDAELDALRNEHNNLSEKNSQATIVVDNSTVVDKAKTAFLNGYLLLIVCDVFFPMAISYLFKKSLEKNGKTRKDLKLTVKDKEELMPLADAAAKELSLTMSAVQTFALAMCFVYASKVDE